MKIRFSLSLLGLALVAASAYAQNPKDAEKALRDSLVKKQLFLRGYSADATVNWKWDGSKLVETDPQYLALSAVTVKSVKLSGAHLNIQGDRQILVRTDGRNAQFAPETIPVTIDVDLGSGDAVKILPEITSTLFYSEMNSAIRDLPNSVVGLIPTPPKPSATATECDCTHAASCSDYIAYTEMKGVKAPSVKNPASAPADAVTVTVVPALDEAGKLQSLWLGRPLDPASDQTALQQAKGYTYTPAMCHADAVGTAFRLDVPLAAPVKGGKGRR